MTRASERCFQTTSSACIRMVRLGLGIFALLIFAIQIYAQGGIPLWTNRYTVPADRTGAYRVAVDGVGNVFVTGSAPAIHQGLTDYVTIGYSSVGVPLWTNRYDGPGHNDDQPSAIAVDKSGHVFVTGSAFSGIDLEYTTLAYSGTGVGLWTNRSLIGYANAIAVDTAGNVFVTGGYQDGSGRADFATIKFSGAGVPLWTNFYNGPANDADAAFAIAVDSSGNVFVTGSSSTSGGFASDWVTVKYSNAGALLWTKRYTSPGGGYDFPTAIGVDGNGNVFVTGSSTPNPGIAAEGATIGYSNSGVPLWTNRSEGYQSALTVDKTGNVFVAGGFSIGYSNPGVPLWTNFFYITGAPRAIATDRAGNVFVTGAYWGVGGAGSTNYFATVAYSGAGVPLWTNHYLATGEVGASGADIAVDTDGNVVVTGEARHTNDYSSFVTIKYSAQATVTSIPLGIQRLGNAVILSWTNATFGLQSAPAVQGAYTNIPGATSPFTNPISGSQQYFRLRGN